MALMTKKRFAPYGVVTGNVVRPNPFAQRFAKIGRQRLDEWTTATENANRHPLRLMKMAMPRQSATTSTQRSRRPGRITGNSGVAPSLVREGLAALFPRPCQKDLLLLFNAKGDSLSFRERPVFDSGQETSIWDIQPATCTG